MDCTHEHDRDARACPYCVDDPEEAGRRTAAATGFAGSVFGAVGGPVGAGIGGLVCGTAGYVAGYTAASAREKASQVTDGPVSVPTREGSEDESADAGDSGEEPPDGAP